MLVTIGTGHGSVIFYDLVADGFLETDKKIELTLKSGKGWLVSYQIQFYSYNFPFFCLHMCIPIFNGSILNLQSIFFRTCYTFLEISFGLLLIILIQEHSL